jgi:hypothetical protein
MELINSLMKPNNQHQLILLVVLILYIVFNIQTPQVLAQAIDNMYGNIVILLVVGYLIMNFNPLVGVIALYAAFELVRRSSVATGSYAIERYLPSQFKTDGHLSAFNQFPVTLEEEVVKQMAPLVEQSGPSRLHYVPMSDNTHNAMLVTDTNSTI